MPLKKTVYWLLSLIITLVFAVFQRMTGPTYPLNDTVVLDGGNVVSFRLPRSCTVAGRDCLIKIDTPEKIDGYISWRRYPSGGPGNETEMSYRDGPRTLGPETDDKRAGDKLEPVPGEPKVRGGLLSALLPDQPPAGKLEYRVFIKREKGALELYGKPVVARFKGAVPAVILVPHILFMFLFMMFSVRIFIAVFTGDTVLKHAVPLNILFLIAGGFIMGPLTQFHAFGAYWTGWPFGSDLTDNKASVLLAFWLAALYAVFRARRPKPWLLAAFAVTALVYLVPHSMFGSQLDYSTNKVVTGGK